MRDMLLALVLRIYWAERDKLPPNFGVALAKTTLEPSAEPVFFGPPFERLGL